MRMGRLTDCFQRELTNLQSLFDWREKQSLTMMNKTQAKYNIEKFSINDAPPQKTSRPHSSLVKVQHQEKHLSYCVGASKRQEVSIPQAEQQEIWAIQRSRKDAPCGKTNLNDCVNLSTRGPGWQFKSSRAPNKVWEAVIGAPKKAAEPIWPSKCASKGLTLRNIEHISGVAGEERIIDADRSIGISRTRNVDEHNEKMIFNKPIQEPVTVSKQVDMTNRPKTFKDLIFAEPGHEAFHQPRKINSIETEKRIFNNQRIVHPNRRYQSNTMWHHNTKSLIQAEESSEYYIDPDNQFNLINFEDRDVAYKKYRYQQKLNGMHYRNRESE